MTEGTPEFAVTVSVRNNRVRKARERLGLSQTDLAKACGVAQGTLNAYECLRASPISKKSGEWLESARKIAEYLGEDLSELFPEAVVAVVGKKTSLTKEFSHEQLLQFVGRELPSLPEPKTPEEVVLEDESISLIRSVVKTLKAREEFVLSHLFGIGTKEKDLTELGALMGISKSRVAQIRDKAFRNLRHPRRSQTLKAIARGENVLPTSCVRCRHVRSDLKRIVVPKVRIRDNYKTEYEPAVLATYYCGWDDGHVFPVGATKDPKCGRFHIRQDRDETTEAVFIGYLS